MENETIGVIVALAGTIIALSAIIWQIIENKKIAHYTLFAEYTKRYEEIALQLPEKLDDTTILDENEKRYLRVYFDLCSEEYFLNTKELLFKDVWKEWEEGMKFAFQNKAVFDYWQERKSFYIHFSKFVDELLEKN